MKALTFILTAVLTIGAAVAQSQTDIYKTGGTVTIQIDPQYAAGTDWAKLEVGPSVTADNQAVPAYRSLAVADDGSAFVCNYRSYTIQKFDPSGRPLKSFGQEGSADGQFRSRPVLHGVLDNHYIFTSEANGRLSFFDLGGNFVKVIHLDYMPLQCVPLRDNRIAIVGHVPYGEGRVRNIVAIRDITTGDENIVLSIISDPITEGAVSIKTKTGQIVMLSGRSSEPWIIARTPDGNLVACGAGDSKVAIFSPDGASLGEFSMDIKRVKAPADERQKLRQSFLHYADSLSVDMQRVDKALDSVSFPEYLPYVYSLIVDSRSNLLAFTYSEEKNKRTFQAYTLTPAGRLLGSTALTSDEYELNLNPRLGVMQFQGDYVYAVVTPKSTPGSPARLVRGRMTSK